MIDSLILTQNAQFFRSPNDLTDAIVTDIFDKASDNLDVNRGFILNTIRSERRAGTPQFVYKYSIRIYPSVRGVYFLNNTALVDTIHSYILLLEFERNVVVLKKSTSNINDVLQSYFDLVGHSSLINSFDDDQVEFQKLALRNMTVSGSAVRAKTYEAADLKGVLSVHAAGRSIPYFLRIRQGDILKTISTTTGRIVEASERRGIDDIAIWAKGQTTLLAGACAKSFLDAFATPISLKDVLLTTQPKAILVEVPALVDRITHENLQLKRISKRHGAILLNPVFIANLLKKLELVYEIHEDRSIMGVSGSKIKVNDKTITFSSKHLRGILITDKGADISLQAYLIKYGLYSICFSNPKYMYYMAACFEDRSGVSEIKSLLEMLVTKFELNPATSEKGSIIPTSVDFEPDSIFKIVENIHNDDDYIFCDDLGTEWADHITFNINESCISFIHSKHGEESTSASNLHEVVGQGIKNLGNMFFNKDYFMDKKRDKFNHRYNGSRISRLRKGTRPNLNADMPRILSSFKLNRKCILCCTFLSKAEVETEFRKIQRNRPVKGHIIQLMWILSSFAHAAKEMNVIPLIYCRP